MIKKVSISLAKPGEYLDQRRTVEVIEAIHHANLNLKLRHSTSIVSVGEEPDTGNLLLTLTIPDDISESFNVGLHLKGIARYLFKNYPEYRDLCVGKRLFCYRVIDTPEVVEKEVTKKGESIDISKVPLGTYTDFGMAVMFKTEGEYHVSVRGESIIITKEG